MKKNSLLLLFFLLLFFYGNAQKQLVLCTTGRGLDRNSSIGIDSEMWSYIQKWATLSHNGQDASVTAVRLHIEWNQYEPTLGNYQGAKLVAALQAIKSLNPNIKLALHFSYLRPGALNDSYFGDEDVARLGDGTKAQDDIAHTAVSIFSATARTRFINFVNNAMSAISAYHNDLLYVQMGNSDAEEYIIPIIKKDDFHQPAYFEEKALQSWRTEYLPCRYPGQSTVTWGSNTYNIADAPPFKPFHPATSSSGAWYEDFNGEHGREYHRFAAWGLMRLYKQFRDAVKSHNSNIKVLYFTPGFGTEQTNIKSMSSATFPAAYNEFDGIYTSDGTSPGDTWRKIMALDVLKGTNANKIAAVEFDPTDLGQQVGMHGVWPGAVTEWFARSYKHGADYIHFAMHFWNDEIDQLAPAIAAIKATYVTPSYTPPARAAAVTKNIFPDVFTGRGLFDQTWDNLGGSTWSTTDNTPKSISMSDVGYWENVNSCTPINNCDYNISASGPSTSVGAGVSITLNSTISGQSSGVSYSWSGTGISGSNTSASVTFNTPSTAGTYTYTLTTSKSGCTNKTATVSVTVASSGGGGAYTAEFDNFFNNRLSSSYNNHVVAIVGCGDNILYTYNRGFTADQPLRIMSLTKWTTAAIIMMLKEEGKLALTDKVGAHIPSWNANGKENVTIQQLLAHTSGVPVQTPYDDAVEYTLAQAVDNIATIPLNFTPGTQFEYGSSSYKVAARIAEVIEGKKWKTIFAERLAAVSGMPNAHYSNSFPYSDENPSPGYGLEVSANEYANYLKMMVRYGWYNGVSVIDSASVAIMEQKQNTDGGFNNYGLGVFRDAYPNGNIRTVWHPGATGTFAFLNREKKYYALVFAQNGDPASLASRDFKDLVDQQFGANICGSTSSDPCQYSVTPTGPTGSVNTGSSVTLNSSCTGQCSGVSYSWSGPGISGSNTSTSVTFAAPSNAGTYTYTLTTSKSGCTNQTKTIQVVVVNGGGTGGTINQCLEAENMNGTGSITSDPNASNGSTRGDENDYNKYVDYVVTSVPSAGNYTATLQYYAASAPTVSVSVNGGSPQTVSLAATYSWNIVHTTQSFTVALIAGTNTIRILGTGGGSCRQDKLCVVGTGTGCSTPSAPMLSASPSAITSGGSAVLKASGCSGGTITWSTGQTGDSISVSPTATTTYTATCSVGSCTSPVASITVTVSQSGGSNPCNLVNQATIGTWNGLSVQARQYTVNGNTAWLIVTAVPGSSTDKHFPRGANFASRTDITWTNGKVDSSCFAGGGTSWGGLTKPSGITTPAGYAAGTEPDGAEYFYQSCTAPAAPTLSASPSSIVAGTNTQVTLTASGCSGGTINWSHSLGSGTTKTVSPTSSTTYTATCTVGGCTSSAGSVLVTVTPGNFSQCIESENSAGNGSITNDPNASNGSTRGDENDYNKYVDYVVTGVPAAGNYTLTLQYYAANTAVVSVKVGSGTPQTVNLAATHSWNIVHTTQSVTVALAAGSNTIRIQGTGGASCRQDKICVSNTQSSSRKAGPGATANGMESSNSLLSVYPNPATGHVDVRFELATGKKATLIVSDATGKTINARSIKGNGKHIERLNFSGKASGIYFVQLRKDNETTVKKIVVIR
ncbi:MAG: serine hydrolase [Agriterribacter sp.]